MAVPTITSISPNVGHTGGRTLIALAGTNFRLPTAPAPTGPTTPPPPSVRVLVGGQAAEGVLVESATLLYCLTPENDEVVVATPWTVDPGTDVFAAVAHGLANATPVRLVPTSGALPSPLDPDRAYYVVAASANAFQLSETVAGPAVDVAAAGSGSARSVGAAPVTVENVTDLGVLIPGETATLAAAFTYRRPDFGQEGELARVVRAMLRSLRRQVLPNVHFATHTDYDAVTGDLLNLAAVQELPAIVLANLEVSDDADARVDARREFPADAGRFVIRAPPTTVTIKYDLIGVSDDPVEVLNLLEAVRRYFRKNAYLRVDRSGTDPAQGSVQYDLEFYGTVPAAVTHQGDNTNVESFAGEVRVRGVLLEDMPGAPTAKPPGIPASLPHEATVGYGHVTVDSPAAVELDVQPHED